MKNDYFVLLLAVSLCTYTTDIRKQVVLFVDHLNIHDDVIGTPRAHT